MSGDKMDKDMPEKDSLGLSSQEEDLDSIMQELESLEQEQETAPVATEAPVKAAEKTAEKPAPTPVATTVEEASNAVPIQNARRAKTSSGAAASSQSLTMEITGTLNLKLGFMSGTKSVELICTDEALVCRFGDGTEIRIPTENPRATTYRRGA